MNPDQKKKKRKAVGFLELEIKLVHAVHTEKGKILVRIKSQMIIFSKETEERKQTFGAAV